ncbi:MAG: DNA polymerase III subunit gamma/tau [Bacteroidales bacterium]|nr:DNA polymerase III subunit gamma/tau [Bacteroidales bacterium]
MAQYIVSARKYRPDSFEALIGQDNIARTLKNSILRGQLAHAYLFCGPRGVGKTSAARIFAKTINCSHPSADMEPCGECESCVSFREGRSYCIHELDAASNNGVEDIKALMEQVQIPPQVGRYSVYIIDEVHMLTQSAFNAFLKTLEEPPAHAIFILATTEKHKIIPTILSRCQTYDFNRISVPDIVRNLRDIAGKEGVKVDDESLHVIAHKADGAMRDALTIFDQTVAFCGTDIHYEDVIRNLNVLDYEYSFRLVDAFLAKDYATALLTFDEILSKGFNSLHFISALGSHLRDLLVSRTGGLESLLDLPDSLRERYREQAGRCSVKFLYEALGVIAQCEGGYKAATNQRLHIEFALMRLSFLGGVPAVSAPAAGAGQPPKDLGEGRLPGTAAVAAESAVAAEPAVILSEQSEPKNLPEAPKPRARRRASGLSLASLIEGEEITVELAPEESSAAAASLPDAATLESKWQELSATYTTSQPRLANALSGAKVTVEEADGGIILSFALVNEAQKNWIAEKKLRELEERFRKICDCPKIRLEPCVVPEEEQEDKIYMPQEKARDLMSKNAEVGQLVKDLALDIR